MQYVVVNDSQHIVLYHSTTYSVTVLLVNILISTFLPYLPTSSNTGRSDGVVRKKPHICRLCRIYFHLFWTNDRKKTILSIVKQNFICIYHIFAIYSLAGVLFGLLCCQVLWWLRQDIWKGCSWLCYEYTISFWYGPRDRIAG